MPSSLSNNDDTKTPVISASDSVLDIVDSLSKDDEKDEKDDKNKSRGDEDKDDSRKTETKGEDKDEDRDDKDEDEVDELSAEGEGEEGDKIDLKEDEVEIDVPPRKKELIKAYPDIFKKFPSIEKIIYRDREYTQLFGSFDDAKVAAERAETLEKYETQLFSGNTEEFLSDIKQSDSKAFTKIAHNILPTIGKIDRIIYNEIVGDIVKQLTTHMMAKSEKTKDVDIKTAAEIVNEHVFGTKEVEAPRPEVKDEKSEELSRREQEFDNRRLAASVNDLSLRVGNTLKNTVDEYIDKKGEMTPFEKKNAIREALEYVDSEIGKDTAFKKQLDKLWKGHQVADYSKASLDMIRSTYLGKAKNLLQPAIKRARAEALKGKTPSRRISDEESDTSQRDRKGPITPGHSAPKHSGKLERKKGESEMDFLMRD